jgi:hypothetical protein
MRYLTLRDSWLRERQIIQAQLATYFPHIGRCWYIYSDTVTDFISLSKPKPSNFKTLEKELRSFFEGSRKGSCARYDQVPTYVRERQSTLVDRIVQKQWVDKKGRKEWEIYNGNLHQLRLRAYADLGELLLLSKEGINAAVVASDAEGYSHFLW